MIQVIDPNCKIEAIKETIVPSVHYATIAQCLRENMELLSRASGESGPENTLLLNIGSAFLALSDALQDEFVYINTRLTYIEQQIDRPDLLGQSK